MNNESVAEGPLVVRDALTLEPVTVIGAPSRFESLRQHWPSLLALGVILVFIVAWILRDSLSPFSASAVRPTRALLPMGSEGSPLGTDGLGRDLFARILAGVPFSLLFGAVPAASGMVIGAAIGLVAGYAGGKLDRAMVWVMDVLLTFPFILLAILVAAVLGASLQNAIIAVTLSILPKNARLIRSQTLSLKHREFIVAARLAGAGPLSIIVQHLLPNVLPTALIVASTDVGLMITLTAGLSFIGLGVQPPDVDWGVLVAEGSRYVTSAPNLAFIPSVVIATVSIAFVVLADTERRLLRSSL
jgi:ABC-type dipeptide/oligopeptide/nickel transport system permease subunit